MKALCIALVVVAACGGGRGRSTVPAGKPKELTRVEQMIALLPEGVQLLIEIDLARLRANQVVGEVATNALARMGEETKVPGLPMTVEGSPLAKADLVVLAAWGVGTPQAAMVMVLATSDEETTGTKLGDGFVALGPEDWVSQLEARAAISKQTPLQPSLSLMSLRDHAMPAKAPGAVLRVTAQLPFDARISLARQTGLETAPAQISIWGDVVDDLGIIIDADAADPGDKKAKESAARLSRSLTTVLSALGDDPIMRTLGLSGALRDMRMITERNWVRVIIVVGPRQLARAVERAKALLPQ